MFTGLIQYLGRIDSIDRRNEDCSFTVRVDELSGEILSLGESIAVNGVCLTVTTILERGFSVDVSGETLSCTTLGTLTTGSAVNLERCVTPESLLGGHLVTGHVDGVGTLVERHAEGQSEIMCFQAPADLSRYIARKGSITVDGVSLTVNRLKCDCFYLNLIPHTLKHTTIGEFVPGQKVNLEVDLVARYVERLLDARAD